jgi:hypothetical protein
MNEYLFVYLAGCLVALFVILLKAILQWFLLWISKENVLQKNLKKLEPPDARSFHAKALTIIGVLLFESLLSWINVVVGIWQIIALPLKLLRARLAAVPEEVKQLRFPLWNNPMLSREAVWAHSVALSVKAGEIIPDDFALNQSLWELMEYHEGFDAQGALKRLAALGVLSEEDIARALDRLPDPD